MKPIELTDILTYTFLSSPIYSPGSTYAAFVASNANEEENTYERRLYLTDGKTVRQLTSIGREGSFVWDDDNHLLFPAVRSAKEKKRAEAGEEFTSYYRLALDGGEALPAFTLPFACSTLIPIGNGTYAALGSIDRAIPDYYCMTDEARARVAANRKENADYEVFDELPFWANGGGVTNGKRTALFLCKPDEGSVERITLPEEDVSSCVAFKGKIYYAVSSWQTVVPLFDLRVNELDPVTGAVRTIVTDEKLMVPMLQPMGDRLLAFTNDGARYGLNENLWVWQIDTEAGTLSVLREEQYNMYSSVGTDCRLGGGAVCCDADGALYHLTTREGSSHLYRLKADGSDTPVLEKDGSIDAIAACNGSGTVLMVAMFDLRLQELYALDLASGRLTRLTRFNDEALKGRYVAKPEPLNIVSEGLRIGGWVMKPKDYDSAKTYPAVFDIHGGPKTVYGPVFMHEMQLWASMGYFVFYCNPKGADGRDNAFADIRGEYGETDYRNLMDFTDAVLAAYPQIDPKRVCETGGSYGGFMTNWIIGHTDRFCCAASQRSISNWLSFYGVSDIGWCFAGDQCASTPWQNMEHMWSRSPLKYAPNAKTPTLFIHSDEDYRCPLPEGLQMYAALCERGVETRLCLFHGENHELSRSGKPKHRIRRLREITDWFEKYAK